MIASIPSRLSISASPFAAPRIKIVVDKASVVMASGPVTVVLQELLAERPVVGLMM